MPADDDTRKVILSEIFFESLANTEKYDIITPNKYAAQDGVKIYFERDKIQICSRLNLLLA